MIDSSTISEIAKRLSQKGAELESCPGITAVIAAAETIGKAWSGSWLGYHSRVYYRDFEPVPPGARFSKEWGFTELHTIEGTVGDWEEYAFDAVVKAVYELAGTADLESE